MTLDERNTGNSPGVEEKLKEIGRDGKELVKRQTRINTQGLKDGSWEEAKTRRLRMKEGPGMEVYPLELMTFDQPTVEVCHKSATTIEGL